MINFTIYLYVMLLILQRGYLECPPYFVQWIYMRFRWTFQRNSVHHHFRGHFCSTEPYYCGLKSLQAFECHLYANAVGIYKFWFPINGMKWNYLWIIRTSIGPMYLLNPVTMNFHMNRNDIVSPLPTYPPQKSINWDKDIPRPTANSSISLYEQYFFNSFTNEKKYENTNLP